MFFRTWMWNTLYEAPLAMERESLAQVACECMHLECPTPDLTDWEEMVQDLRSFR